MKAISKFGKASLMVIALLAAGTGISKADTGKKDKVEKTEKVAEAKWFHFNGDASSQAQLDDPMNYSPVSSPGCESTTLNYRCEILIEPQASNANLPDLSKTVQAETTRSTPE